MIGSVVEVVRRAIVEPQALETVPEDRRIVLDPANAPVDADAQTVEVAAGRTRPGPRQIGRGSVVLVHEAVVIVAVMHGDPPEAIRRRDLVVFDLVQRFEAEDWTVLEEVDALERCLLAEWVVDYSTLAPDTMTEYATITCTLTTERAASL